ncbi:hypothetical protein V4F39_17975 [Aquincola sp. MAHUQ-54]|uniref:Uncharacterized protein n=2 Tax=Aquincola TaxID=391952 RepID=A0AAW9QJZ3_9BURK
MLKTIAANPFALMVHPETVLQAVERSERLARLHSRVCRPLDKPLIPKSGEVGAFDQDIDAELDEVETS